MRKQGFVRVAAVVIGAVAVAGGVMSVHLGAAGSDGAPAKSGIYLVPKEGDPKAIPASTTTEIEMSGVGKSILTQGFTKPHATAVHPGARAGFTVAEASPTFLFRFAPPMNQQAMAANPMAMMEMMEGLPPQSSSPKDFALARLVVDGESRRLEPGKNPMVKCTVEQVEPRVFKVIVAEPLTPGEYAFYLSDARKGGGNGGQLWAFSVPAAGA